MEAENKYEEITKLAYAIYQKRVEEGLAGDSATDWVMAEQEWNQMPTTVKKTTKKKAEKKHEHTAECEA